MAMPTIRYQVSRDSDSMVGVSYIKKTGTFLVNITQAATAALVQLGANTWLTEARAVIRVALDGSGTVAVNDGTHDLIEAADWDESSVGAIACNVTAANAANGKHYTAATTISVVVGGSPTEGQVLVYLEWLEVDTMAADPNRIVTV